MTVPLYVPKGCKESYQASKVWSVFANIVEEKIIQILSEK
jgi:hypothetical protein